MSKIVVNRKSEWANKGRKIELYLNGKNIGTIGDGETREFDVEPGLYFLYAKIDWCRSPIEEINIGLDQIQFVELSGFKKSQWLFPVLLIASVFSWFLGGTGLTFITLVIIIPLLLYLFYFVTFGRKKYLQLKLKPNPLKQETAGVETT